MWEMEYRDMKKRILESESIEKLRQLESQLNNLYKNGVFDPKQMGALDTYILDRMAEYE